MLQCSLLGSLPPCVTRSCSSFRAHRAAAPSRLQHGCRRQHAPLLRQRTLTARRRQTLRCAAAAGQDYYKLLGVERAANGKEIKSAFRKKALKLHPDVNKAPDAKEQFMAAKEAFQVLSDAQSRSTYDRQLSGVSGGFDWGNPFGGGSRGSGASGSRSGGGAGGQKQRQQSDEPFYGFGAFFDDLENEWKERRRRRQKEPQSLWEELADIGEEFVEFLEKEIGLPSWEAEAEARSSDSGSRNEAARRAGYAAQQQQKHADAGAQQAARNAEAGAKSAVQNAQSKAKAAADDVEDALAELKRKMNKM